MQLRGVLILITFVSCGLAANILGIFPLTSNSHFVMFQRLFLKLAEKGHEVDIVTHFPIKDPPQRYNQLSVRGSLPIFVNNISLADWPSFNYFQLVSHLFNECGVATCNATLNTPVLKQLKTTKKKYDLVMTEIFGSDCMLGFGHLFRVPVVSLVSSVAVPWANDRIGNPDNPSYVANYFLKNHSKMGLLERIYNVFYYVMSKFLYNRISNGGSNEVAKNFFGPDLPQLEELASKTSLILVNSHFTMNQARPVVPNFVEVGGLHITAPKPLPEHLEEVVRTGSGTKGVIYLTMGSMVMTETFPIEQLQGMFDAFAQLPYKVLWKAVKEKFPEGLKFPRNIHFEPWMPQMDLLCHPNVKLFVSHGGLMGSQEAVYCGVPRLGIPLFSDQEANVRNSEALGVAIRVDPKNISKESILEATTELLTNSKYKQNAEKLSELFKDRPLSPLNTAIYWVEYVIRHEGAPHLRCAGADLPWYQYYLVDVVLVLLSTSCGILYLLCFATKIFLVKIKEKQD